MKKLFNENVSLVYKVFHEKIEPKMKDKSMTEDVLQIGMLALWRACTKYDPKRGVQFSTYAYSSIYKSMLCSVVREKKKNAYIVSMNNKILKDENETDITYEDVIASPVNIIAEVEINDMVDRISKTIDDNAEKVVNMLREGHTQTDIAKEMNITRSNVGRILKQFRKRLKNTLFFEE